MLLSDFIRDGAARLETLYPSPEARGLVLMLCRELLGETNYTHIVEPQTAVPAGREGELSDALRRLCAGEPVQYVLGVAEFCDRRFAVGPGVLIPRPETELLVAEAVRTLRGMELDRAPQVLDLCTGSGCITWTLALDLPGTKVVGVDLSEAALRYARSQFSPAPGGSGLASGGQEKRPRSAAEMPFGGSGLAPGGQEKRPRFAAEMPFDGSGLAPGGQEKRPRSAAEMPSGGNPLPASGRHSGATCCHSGADPESPVFLQADVLDTEQAFPYGPFDLIVSNPPYVMERERAEMRPNVLDWEPGMALFVPDGDPLRFYRATARWAQRFLRPGGVGIVEINEALGPETAAVFREAGFRQVRELPDLNKKIRFVRFS